jgi:hypothetical protein
MLSKKALASSSGVVQPSGLTFSTAGTYSFVVPNNVTSLTAVAIGAGGGGGGASSAATSSAGGGGGGALSYSNTISVTPGETLTVVVGSGGSSGSTSGTAGSAGGDSYIRRSSTDLLLAKGGSGGGGNTGSSSAGGGAGGDSASGVGDTKNSGGAGGARATNDRGGGGGGAAGYSGTGGAGGFSTTNPTAGAGGGGGGGYFGYDGTTFTAEDGGWGGGTQFYGSGTNGLAGVVGATEALRTGGLGSSLGTTAGASVSSRFPGGGGGGASSDGLGNAGRAGESGLVRVLWGGTKSFPSTGVTNTTSFFASANSNTSTITVPSQVVPGDFLVLFDIAFNPTTNPTKVIPSGFTELATATGSNGRINTSYKQVLDASDSNTVLTGMDGATSNNKILLVLRGTNGYSFVSNSSVTTNISTASLGSTSLGDSSVDSYAQGISISLAAFYGSGGITPGTDISFTGATFIQGASNVFYVGYKIYSQSDTNVQTTGITLADKGINGWSLVQFKGY